MPLHYSNILQESRLEAQSDYEEIKRELRCGAPLILNILSRYRIAWKLRFLPNVKLCDPKFQGENRDEQ